MFSFLSVSVTWFLAVVVSVAFSCAALLFLLFLYFWVADTHCLGWCLMPSDQTHSNSDNQIHISLLKHVLPFSRPWIYDSHLWSQRCQFCHQWNRSYTLPWRAFKFVVTGLCIYKHASSQKTVLIRTTTHPWCPQLSVGASASKCNHGVTLTTDHISASFLLCPPADPN